MSRSISPIYLLRRLFYPQLDDSGCGIFSRKREISGSSQERLLPLPRFRSIVLAVGCLASLSLAMPAAAADIRSTPHNLAQNGTRVETDEVCVFCHTPQITIGAASIPAAQPAWQRSLSQDHSFVMFDDIGRKQFGKAAVGSQSIACLSCHDSAQALQVSGGMSDHPFGVPYRGFTGPQGGFGPTTGGGAVPFRSAVHLKGIEDFRLPSRGRIESRTVWWVSVRGDTATRSRSDLPLYVREEEGREVPYVECGSCHDPHIARPLFLRVSNEGSRLCLTCHDK